VVLMIRVCLRVSVGIIIVTVARHQMENTQYSMTQGGSGRLQKEKRIKDSCGL